MLFADAPFVLDHHKADAACKSGIKLCVMEPTVHFFQGVLSERRKAFRRQELDGNEPSRDDDGKHEDEQNAADLGSAGELVENNKTNEDCQHSEPLHKCAITVNLE